MIVSEKSAERKVQYEYRLVVQVDEWVWPHEIAEALQDVFNDQMKRIKEGMVIVEVEQIRDHH